MELFPPNFSCSRILFDFIFFLMSELSTTEIAIAKTIQEQEEKFNRLLNAIGLQTPIDYIFLDFALQKSRLNLEKITDTPHFLFHTISKTDIQNKDRPFPHCLFIEKKSYKKFDVNAQTTLDAEHGIIWSLTPSDFWETRDILPFTDFHLYFMDVLKPLYNYSAEELYRLFDEKQNETFFVSHGNRSSTEQRRIVTLFCTPKHIVVFHFDDIDISDVSENEKFFSKWISADLSLSLHSLTEFALFHRPSVQLVPKTETVTNIETNLQKEKIERKVMFSTPGLDTVGDDDCMNCSA